MSLIVNFLDLFNLHKLSFEEKLDYKQNCNKKQKDN
ncbi:hypothetical protein EV145_103153 [Flavobacterium sp. 245]|nr:hypothetical protein EV145_103153 [Flavobacterium sp. 245]